MVHGRGSKNHTVGHFGNKKPLDKRPTERHRREETIKSDLKRKGHRDVT
jgi:hypothetical protein